MSTDDYYPLLEKVVGFDADVLGWVLLTYFEVVMGKYSLWMVLWGLGLLD